MMEKVIYDPYLIFDKINSIVGMEARLHCPHPSHTGHDTNASFNFETGSYICFGNCGFKTNNVRKLILWLYNECGLEPHLDMVSYSSLPLRSLTVKDWKSLVRKRRPKPNEKVYDYLKSRGIYDTTMEDFDLRVYGEDEGVIMPIFDIWGELAGCNIRYITKGSLRYQTIYDKDRIPYYAVETIPHYTGMYPIVITEGAFGTMKGFQYGVQTVATLGDNNLKSFDYIFPKFNKVVVAVDNDAAGYKKAFKFHKLQDPRVVFAPPAEYDEISKYEWAENIKRATPLFSEAKKWFDF